MFRSSDIIITIGNLLTILFVWKIRSTIKHVVNMNRYYCQKVVWKVCLFVERFLGFYEKMNIFLDSDIQLMTIESREL